MPLEGGSALKGGTASTPRGGQCGIFILEPYLVLHHIHLIHSYVFCESRIGACATRLRPAATPDGHPSCRGMLFRNSLMSLSGVT